MESIGKERSGWAAVSVDAPTYHRICGASTVFFLFFSIFFSACGQADQKPADQNGNNCHGGFSFGFSFYFLGLAPRVSRSTALRAKRIPAGAVGWTPTLPALTRKTRIASPPSGRILTRTPLEAAIIRKLTALLACAFGMPFSRKLAPTGHEKSALLATLDSDPGGRPRLIFFCVFILISFQFYFLFFELKKGAGLSPRPASPWN